MDFTNTIDNHIKEAMKAKDNTKLRGLRAIKAALLLAKSEKGASDEISEDVAIKIMQKLVKQRKDSLAIYQEQGRDELAKSEKEEIEVIQNYLPEQLSEEAIKQTVVKIIEQTGAQSMQDMGKVMGMASKELAGKADGKIIAEIVKRELNN